MDALKVTAVAALLLSALATVAAAGEQRFELGGQLVSPNHSEFDSTDFGLGAQFGYRLTSAIFLEAELNFFPGDLTEDRPFSSHRLEGLFGIRAGRRWERAGVFAKLRPGFLTFGEAAHPFPCIRIYPPPLECSLALGDTVSTIDFGGVLELYPWPRTFVRLDAGDQMIRFHGPVLRNGLRDVADDSFFSHNFRFSVGVGARS